MCTVQNINIKADQHLPMSGTYGKQILIQKKFNNEKVNRNEERFFFFGKQKT